MPPLARTTRGGAIKLSGAGAPALDIRIQITGVDRTQADLRRVRSNINTGLRDAQQQVGERVVLPDARQRLARYAGGWASSLYVKRDRLDVFIGSRLRGGENRALGWLDFGGKRRRDTSRRVGPYTIVGSLQSKQDEIREQIGDAALDEFAKRGFEVT